MRNNLVELRHNLGLTQEEMAKLVNCTRGQWCNIEKARRQGSADMWLLLGTKLNLTLEEIQKLKEVS